MNYPVKLLMDWNIKPGREEAYFDFITRDFIAVFLREGFHLTDAWYTLYGDWPQMKVGFLADDLPSLREFLASESWSNLKIELLDYIHDYHQKVIQAKGGFQL